MGYALLGVTISSDQVWSQEQCAAVQLACREVLGALRPEAPPSEDEVTAYWQAHVERPNTAFVRGELRPFSAYWQLGQESWQEWELLVVRLGAHCRPLGMKIDSHFSI